MLQMQANVPRRKSNPLKKLLIWRSPRTPVEYSEILESIEHKMASKLPVPFVAFEQLLKKLGNSARLKFIWADMEKANYLVYLMRSNGYELDSSCSRSLLLVAAEECWRGELVKDELWGLFDEIKNSPNVEVYTRAYNTSSRTMLISWSQVDLEMINVLLGAIAGLASQSRASFEVVTQHGTAHGTHLPFPPPLDAAP
jgi:hypothetical protein